MPVILIGNKIDLRHGQVTTLALVNEIVPIMSEFKEVETCIECSAKLPLNVSEVSCCDIKEAGASRGNQLMEERNARYFISHKMLCCTLRPPCTTHGSTRSNQPVWRHWPESSKFVT